jgi:hypothetical protein
MSTQWRRTLSSCASTLCARQTSILRLIQRSVRYSRDCQSMCSLGQGGTNRSTPKNDAIYPTVLCGRAVQEDFGDPAYAALRQCIRLRLYAVVRALWISARKAGVRPHHPISGRSVAPATSCRSSLRHPGQAHALIHTLASGEVSRIVALCAAAEAAESEGRIEDKASLRGGPRLV